MYTLARQVRFSINPFLSQETTDFTDLVSDSVNPCKSVSKFAGMGEGLSLYFELSVELVGKVDPATGFVVNVTDIDNKVREFGIPIFARQIRANFKQGKSIGLSVVAELLRSVWVQLTDKFGSAHLTRLSLKLNPFRKIAIDSEELAMIYFSEKFSFAAGHKLWNDQFSQKRNIEIFGKCANPAGHGHNYVVEVTIKGSEIGDLGSGIRDFCIGDFEKVINNQLIKVLDHKNLNVDVAEFAKTIPTVENIAAFAWNRLVGKFGDATLHCVTVWETDKTRCSYYDGK